MELKDNMKTLCDMITHRFNCGFVAVSNYAAMFMSSQNIIFIVESPGNDPDDFNVSFSPACSPAKIAEIMKFLMKIPSANFNIAQDFYINKDSKLSHGKDAVESFIYDMIDSIETKVKPQVEKEPVKKFTYSGYPEIDERDYNFEGDEAYYGAESKEKRHNKKVH